MNKYGQIGSILAYSCAVIIGSTAAYLTFPNAHHSTVLTSQPIEKSPVQKLETKATGPNTQTTQSLATTASAVSGDEKFCIGLCLETSNRLTSPDRIDDESFEKLFGEMHELAAYLETNYVARMDMLDLAMSTPEGKRRKLIVNAFSLLPVYQQEELGAELLKSDNWRARTDGVTLSISPESLTSDKAARLMNVLRNETHSHVKNSILGGVENAKHLKGDSATLDHLSNIMLTETVSSVRSDAMLAKLALSEHPHDAMSDAFMALRSGDIELQRTAFIVFEKIYETNDLVDGGLDKIDHNALQRALEDFMDVEINDDNRESMHRLLMEADRFYERHF